jgi:hypothetical protein
MPPEMSSGVPVVMPGAVVAVPRVPSSGPAVGAGGSVFPTAAAARARATATAAGNGFLDGLNRVADRITPKTHV